jgi:membrane-bound hydrogenase subunit beta
MSGLLTLDMVSGKMAEYGLVEQARNNRIRISTPPQKILGAIKAAQQLLGCDRLISISCMDNGETFGLVYHLTGPHRSVISITLEVPRGAPETFTVSDILPSAGIYERQIHDLFGIVFPGNPNMKKLMLNEDWPDGEYPLRKDWKPKKENFYGGVRSEVI